MRLNSVFYESDVPPEAPPEVPPEVPPEAPPEVPPEVPEDASLTARLSALEQAFSAHLVDHVSSAHTHELPAELLIITDAVKELDNEEQAPKRQPWYYRKLF